MMTDQEFNSVFAQANKLWETDFFKKHGTAAIKKFMDNAASDFSCRIHGAMRDMESPLEAAFFAWWGVRNEGVSSFYLAPQFKVTVGGNEYRLDFAALPSPHGGAPELVNAPECPRIAIELDGHDFHEKTKAQVTYRNRRDRDLQAAGWIVLHVSGSEFNANPEKVVDEIYDRVSDVMFAAWRKMHGRE